MKIKIINNGTKILIPSENRILSVYLGGKLTDKVSVCQQITIFAPK
jgi:hypothetical protein